MRLNNYEIVEVEKILATVRFELGESVKDIMNEERLEMEYFMRIKISA